MMDNVGPTADFPDQLVNESAQQSPTSTENCWDLVKTPISCYNQWRDFQFYALAFIVPTGLVLNSVCFGVFASSWMRRTIPGRYFMALALADNLVLTGELLNWLNTSDRNRGYKLGLDFCHTIDGMCKLLHFLRYGARMMSSWVTVSITIERFLTVTFPFQVRRISSPTKAIIVVTIEAVLCFSLASFAFFTLHSGVNGNVTNCIVKESYKYIYYFLILIVIVIGELVLPSIIVLIFTVLIIRKLLHARRARQTLSSSETVSRRRQAHPTIALVIIAIAFVTIRLPYVILFTLNQFSKKIWPSINARDHYIIYILYHISKVLAVLNYATNFLFFCIAGNTFRAEMMKLCPWAPPADQRRGQTLTSSASLYRERSINTEIYLKTYGRTSVRKLTAGTHLSLSSSGSSCAKTAKEGDSEHEGGQRIRRPSGRDLAIVENNPGVKRKWLNKKEPSEVITNLRDPLLNNVNTPNNIGLDGN